MATTNPKVHGIIHTTFAYAGAVGGDLAQIPGFDMPIIAITKAIGCAADAYFEKIGQINNQTTQGAIDEF